MVEVTQDPDGEAVERCCLCKKRTSFWFTPKDVALCRDCAKTAVAKDIPTKEEWWPIPGKVGDNG